MLNESLVSFSVASPSESLSQLQVDELGLSTPTVKERQKEHGRNIIEKKKLSIPILLFRELKGNPLTLILAAATAISYALGQHISAYYIFGIILLSTIFDFWNEYTAGKTIENLLKKISPTTVVLRDSEKNEVQVSDLTVGDIVLLFPGSIIPADLRLLETKNLEVDESLLTGEAQTVYKTHDAVSGKPTILSEMCNIGFMGTHVSSGSGKGVIVRIGKDTEFGKIAKTTTFLKPETEFQKGLTSFGSLIIKVIVVFTVGIFILNTVLGRPILDSLLFSLAIAVGLTPELLPVIVTVSLAHGAGKLAKKHVIAKQLIALENLGNMDILCTDKTGTLTEGKIQVVDYITKSGKRDPEILQLSLMCNSAIVQHKIVGNGIDVALWEYAHAEHIKEEKNTKVEEEPFDYTHKFMYSVVERAEHTQLIAKGAPEAILPLCKNITVKEIHNTFIALSHDGLRVIAVATKTVTKKGKHDWDDVDHLDFQGFITFLDIPKKTAKGALAKLRSLNVRTKIITGDSEIITKKICEEVGVQIKGIVTGKDLVGISSHDLAKIVEENTIFARVNPEQKLMIIQALQKNGHTVGYMGDGINDIPPLHSADIGISVNTAVDVAKDAASLVLLRKSLDVLAEGIIEGRKTFHNTVKYILMSTSSNFGNMFSAAGASLLLPFLPMTAVQILLTNTLYDVSQLSIPTDNADPESLLKPRHWDISFIKRYMLFFGPLSSIFDYATFGILFYFFHARGAAFQTGWFIESLATEILVIFVIRTAKTPFFLSRPSIWLMSTCFVMVAIGLILPFTSLAGPLGFLAPPPLFFAVVIGLVVAYLGLVEVVKSVFLKKYLL